MTARANRSVIAWGDSGAAKTSQIGFLAKRVWKQHHKRTWLISADGGSWAPIQPEIDLGLIEAWAVPPIDGKSIAIFRKLSAGWAPERRDDGRLVLKPPTAERYAEYGLIAWDGLTAVADRVFRDMQQSGLRLGKEDAAAALIEGDADLGGQEKIFPATQSMFLFTQKECRMYVDNCNTLPFERSYWTALESKGEELVGRDMIYGPMLVGTAATGKIPAWFGDCLHMESLFVERLDNRGQKLIDPVTKAPMLEKKIRCYFTDYLDPKTQFKYRAKPRVPSSFYPELQKKWPAGFFDLDPMQGIDVFLDFEDSMLAKQGEELKKLDFDLEKFRAELDKNRSAQVAVPAQVPQVPPVAPTVPVAAQTVQAPAGPAKPMPAPAPMPSKPPVPVPSKPMPTPAPTTPAAPSKPVPAPVQPAPL